STSQVALASVGLSPTSVVGGQSSTGTVTLSGPAPGGGAVVALSSAGTVASVPSSVTVAAGATSESFAVATSGVSTTSPVGINGSYGGATKTATLTVTRPVLPALSSLTLSPLTVIGGSTALATVRLSGPAPAGGALVTLTASNPVTTVPPT